MTWKTAMRVRYFLNLFVLQWFFVRLGLAATRRGKPPYDHECRDTEGHPGCWHKPDWFLCYWVWPLTGRGVGRWHLPLQLTRNAERETARSEARS